MATPMQSLTARGSHKPLELYPTLPTHEYAFVWLLMKGDSYLPGIFTSVYSVLRTKPDADLIVMITDDVSEHAKKMLLTVATHIFTVPYLSYKSTELATKRIREIYASWIDKSYTKWNALALPYKKITFVDGDMIATDNVDHLFKLDTPAIMFNDAFRKPCGDMINDLPGKKAKDGYLFHGQTVPYDYVSKSLNRGPLVGVSCICVLKPSLDDYKLYLDSISKFNIFGFPKVYNGHDEQSIAYFYSVIKKIPWTNIHHRYGYIIWKDNYLSRGDVPYMLHYFSNVKPWTLDIGEYDDLITWYIMANAAIKHAGIKPADINLKPANCETKLPDTYIKKHINVVNVLDVLGKLKNDK